ncbi:hypothetical protein CUJ88_04000 [Paraburkholderia hospita]|nr:hypothetical protein CUJ88_04000 [Paraburkholderia hospita]
MRDQIICVDNFCTVKYIAEFLGHADLVERLRHDLVLEADGLPRQGHIDAGYLAVVVDDDGASPLVLVTPDGMSWMLHRYGMTDEARAMHLAARSAH